MKEFLSEDDATAVAAFFEMATEKSKQAGDFERARNSENKTYETLDIESFSPENPPQSDVPMDRKFRTFLKKVNPGVVFYQVWYSRGYKDGSAGSERKLWSYFVFQGGRWIYVPKPWMAFE